MKRIVVMMALAVVSAGMVPADAHTAGTYYPAEWKRELNQRWSFTPSVSKTASPAAFRDRVRNGIANGTVRTKASGSPR
jgi:hypothetical protein